MAHVFLQQKLKHKPPSQLLQADLVDQVQLQLQLRLGEIEQGLIVVVVGTVIFVVVLIILITSKKAIVII